MKKNKADINKYGPPINGDKKRFQYLQFMGAR